MANEKILEILKEIKADPKAKELFGSMEMPASHDKMIAAYAQIAEKLGYDITAEDIRDAVEQEEARRKEKNDKIVSDMEAMEDDDLEDVAGGYYYIGGDGKGNAFRVYDKCVSDYVSTFCYNSDACEAVVHFYYGCSGKFFEDKEEYDCTASLYCDFLLRWD